MGIINAVSNAKSVDVRGGANMVGIKDMEMPKSCNECPFKANDYVCRLLDCAFSCNHFKERNYNCPLVEIVTCKDCKHNAYQIVKYEDSEPTRVYCRKHKIHPCIDDFCADAKRRE